MNDETSLSELRSGAINFDLIQPTASGLRNLLYGPRDIPIRAAFRSGEFPIMQARPASMMKDYGFVINVWEIRDEVENFHVIGGVRFLVDKSGGHVEAYQRALNTILEKEERSARAFAVLDHVVTNRLADIQADRFASRQES